jgi:hypothetical protein
VKSPKHVVPMLVALTLAVMLGGCSKNTTPTGLSPALDQAPPAVPSRIVAEVDASNGSATLDWTPSSSANAASYEIYQYLPSPQNEESYALIGQTDEVTTTFDLPWTSSQTTLYYRLRTVSSTGVKSQLSELVLATVGPPVGGEEKPGDGIIDKMRP